MPYEANFWIAFAAAAPVIALANVVGLADGFRTIQRLDSLEDAAAEAGLHLGGRRTARAASTTLLVVAFVNLVGQGTLMGYALGSLAHTRNQMSPDDAILFAMFGIFALAIEVTMTAAMTPIMHQMKKTLRAEAEGTQAAQPSP